MPRADKRGGDKRGQLEELEEHLVAKLKEVCPLGRMGRPCRGNA